MDDGSLMQVGDILEFGDASNVPSTDGAPSGFFYKITAISTHVSNNRKIQSSNRSD